MSLKPVFVHYAFLCRKLKTSHCGFWNRQRWMWQTRRTLKKQRASR